MSVFPEHDIEQMNEDDVAGDLVRPLCRALGYTNGGREARLRSQMALQYDKAFLGHRTPKDPVLRGRPDFICDVISYARWVVEAKAPHIELSLSDSQQAHTYATHPEIAAQLYMLTNGRVFRVYAVGRPEEPVLEWAKDETDDNLLALKNILGPEAMKKRGNPQFDLAKPLGPSLPATAIIVGGESVYLKTEASIPMQGSIDGMRGQIPGNRVFRNEDGLIVAEVDVRSPFAAFDDINKAMGFFPLFFSTASEFISSDVHNPTMLQNVFEISIPAGTPIPKTLLSPGGTMPITISGQMYTEAHGFVDGDHFKGTFAVDYDYQLDQSAGMLGLPKEVWIRQEGAFDIRFQATY